MSAAIAATGLGRKQICWRAAQDIPDGAYVNLGIGMPTMCSDYVPEGREVVYQSENGILGVGPVAGRNEQDPGLVDAGGAHITLVRGAAIFDSAESFLMMRGGHLDLTILGAFQVSVAGDLANWDSLDPVRGPMVGGAMDLVHGAKEVRIVMEHTTKAGAPRLVERCTYPLTGAGVVKRVYTNLAVIAVTSAGFVAEEIVPGLDLAGLQAATGAPVMASPTLRPLTAPALD